MSYQYNVTLKKIGNCNYLLVLDNGVQLLDFQAYTWSAAIQQAESFMSSWTSVNMKVEDGKH